MAEFDRRRIYRDRKGDVRWWDSGRWVWYHVPDASLNAGNELGMRQYGATPIAWIRGEGPDEQPDAIHHPDHYTAGEIECIDAIRARLDRPMNGFQAYCLGNVLKYIWRAGMKGDAGEDLEKAAVYLGWAKEGRDDA